MKKILCVVGFIFMFFMCADFVYATPGPKITVINNMVTASGEKPKLDQYYFIYEYAGITWQDLLQDPVVDLSKIEDVHLGRVTVLVGSSNIDMGQGDSCEDIKNIRDTGNYNVIVSLKPFVMFGQTFYNTDCAVEG